jgi:hypothetical protein
MSLNPGRVSAHWSTTAGNLRQQCDVSADGRFLVNVAEETSSPITRILNWKPQ